MECAQEMYMDKRKKLILKLIVIGIIESDLTMFFFDQYFIEV